MSLKIARTLVILAHVFSWGLAILLGLLSTGWLVVLVVNGEWGSAFGYLIIGLPITYFVAGLVHMAVMAVFLGLAHVINRRALEDVH